MIFENEIANFRGMSVVLRTEGNLDDEDSKHRFETVSKRLEKILHQISLHTDYEDRSLRGDYFKKPTGFWYVNCEPTYGESIQPNNKVKAVRDLPSGKGDGLCSEERSMISPDYARNFICDFILGKQQDIGQLRLF